MTKLSAGELMVLRHHLSLFPEDKSMEEICQLIMESDDDVGIWGEFDDWNLKNFIEHLRDLASDIDIAIRKM